MKERPILFSGPMVCAILEGRKTQTRRVVKGDPLNKESYLLGCHKGTWGIHDHVENDGGVCRVKCPYGKPGDSLWVRESFYIAEPYSYGTDPSGEQIVYKGVPHGPVHYAADGFPANTPNRHYPNGLRGGKFAAPDPHAIWISRPSIHMPRWASRLTLEITDVRVERLQSISEDDAKAEGVDEMCVLPGDQGSFVQPYAALWESINGPESWNANPWVWVVEFKQI